MCKVEVCAACRAIVGLTCVRWPMTEVDLAGVLCMRKRTSLGEGMGMCPLQGIASDDEMHSMMKCV